MMYACLKYRSLRIKHLQFKNGLLKTNSKEDKELVESNGFYNAHIFPVPTPEEEISYGEEGVGKNEQSQASQTTPHDKNAYPPPGKGGGEPQKGYGGSGKRVR